MLCALAAQTRIGVAISPNRRDDHVGFTAELATGNFVLQKLLHVRWKVLGKHVEYSCYLDGAIPAFHATRNPPCRQPLQDTARPLHDDLHNISFFYGFEARFLLTYRAARSRMFVAS